MPWLICPSTSFYIFVFFGTSETILAYSNNVNSLKEMLRDTREANDVALNVVRVMKLSVATKVYRELLVWFLFYGPSTHFRSFRRGQLVTLTTLFLGNFVHVLSPVTDNCSSWISRRGRIFFMTKSPRNNVPDVGIELGAACMPSGHASDRATVPGLQEAFSMFSAWYRFQV